MSNMELFFPEDNLHRMTPEETQISDLRVEPYPDGRRLRVDIEITPFQKRPYLEFVLRDAAGEEVSSVSMVEPLSWKLEFTMHVRAELHNPYTLEARLFYPEGPAAAPKTISFNVDPQPVDDKPIDPSPDKPFDPTQDRPFDPTQDRPFDPTQDKPVSA